MMYYDEDPGQEPIAAASLAQVYRATLRETGQEVAVKVQRPGALSTISKEPIGDIAMVDLQEVKRHIVYIHVYCVVYCFKFERRSKVYKYGRLL